MDYLSSTVNSYLFNNPQNKNNFKRLFIYLIVAGSHEVNGTMSPTWKKYLGKAKRRFKKRMKNRKLNYKSNTIIFGNSRVYAIPNAFTDKIIVMSNGPSLVNEE